ncbi:MAG: amidase [Sandaracinus sp.]|nr:amidase [Sandaracinus sp.]MCB9604694.1 amidase [Sandaracinus sp.]MCB9613440.1 amidase [Sandaracinus sp.]
MTRPLHAHSAVELQQLLARGEVRSVEIVEALHARSDEVEPKVGAFAHQLRKQALAEAKTADEARARGESKGPLAGLPVTIKENVDIEGMPSTIGMRARSGKVAGEDAVVVRLLREAGAIVLGKTNVPQTLLAPMESTNALFGTTHNPWRHGHGPGGSSGGEGAAIASGQSVFGIGTDIGGSIRVPASFCGICGLKPTRHRWSNLGSQGVLRGQELVQSQIGPMARTVDDLTLLMRVLDTPKHTPHDPRVPPVPLGEPGTIDPTKLRFGYYEDDGYLTPAASVRRAVREAVALLEAAGCEVVRFTPPNVEEILSVYFRGVSADGTATLLEALEGEPFAPPLKTVGRLAKMPTQARKALATAMGLMGEHRVQLLVDSLGEKRVKDFWALCARRGDLQIEEERAWDLARVDVVLAPAFATTAAPIGMSHDFTLGFASAARYNLLDRPAGVVPVTRVRPDETQRTATRDRIDKRAAEIEAASAGLPVGVQLVGRPWREAELLAAMRLLQEKAGAREDYPATPV